MIKKPVLFLAKWLGLFALFRAITRRATRILCYHGGSLGDEHLFNPKLFCTPALLDQRLEWLQRKGFISCELEGLVQPKKIPLDEGIPLIITLDDGWYSTATDLLPRLTKYHFQPVLYLATKVFVSECPVVDVCIRYIIWKSPLQFVQITAYDPALDGSYDLSKYEDRDSLCAGAEKWVALFGDDSVAVYGALNRLAARLGVPCEALNLESRRFSYMKKSDLLAAAESGCRIELHGHAHRYIVGDSVGNLADIETCRQHIMAVGLPNPRHYCFPSGQHDNDAPKTLKKASVRTGTTCKPGLIHHLSGEQCFFLPRFLDGGDVSMIEFEAEMSGFLNFLRNLTRR